MHVMIDLETLGVRPGSAIVQIGAVLFEPVGGGKIEDTCGLNVYVKPEGGTSVDASTLAWWLGQSEDARRHLAIGMSNAVTEREALTTLVAWPAKVRSITWDTVGGVWANGPTFDISLLQDAFSRHGMEVPWYYRAPRDVRTLYDLTTGGRPPEIHTVGAAAHDALEDAIVQAMQVQKAMSAIGR